MKRRWNSLTIFGFNTFMISMFEDSAVALLSPKYIDVLLTGINTLSSNCFTNDEKKIQNASTEMTISFKN